MISKLINLLNYFICFSSNNYWRYKLSILVMRLCNLMNILFLVQQILFPDCYKNQKQPPEVLCEKRCSLKCCKIHRKAPVSESLLLKQTPVEACNFIKKRLCQRCFPVNFAKFFRTPFSQNTSGRLLLKNIKKNFLGEGSFLH